MTSGLLSLVAAIWFLSFSIERKFERSEETKFADYLVSDLTGLITNELEFYSRMLFITADTTTSILQTGSGKNDFIETIFTNTMKENPNFFQIRYIDSTGKEIYRVDRILDAIVPMSDVNLKAVSDRYYFHETVHMEDESLYISPLDLDVNQGEITVPWIPTLRLATPIPDPENGGRGIVIININMNNVLSIFQAERETDRHYLLNSEGYYLAGAEKEKLWSFMFERPITFGNDYPDAWVRISAQEEGAFVLSQKLYTFKTIRVTQTAKRGKHLTDVSSNRWKIVLIKDVNARVSATSPLILVLLVLSIIIALLISWFWSKSIVERHEALISSEATKAALIKSEKMASLGRLVAGVAHELNTPIGSSVTIASALKDEVTAFATEINGGQIRKSRIDAFISSAIYATDTMMTSLNRAAALVMHFKQVSVDQSSERRRTFTIPEYIHNILDTLRPTFKHRDITVTMDAQNSIELDSYPGAFAQVITNIINNAITHAFPDNAAGSITIQVKKQQDTVVISIRDNGLGIPQENLEHIFEPFFTTTGEIGGSGLGMHIVYNIINNLLEGKIQVKSEVGRYTEFIMTLPLRIEHNGTAQERI